MSDPHVALPTALDPRVLDLPAVGRNLQAGTVGDQLGAASTLLVFLPDLDAVATREVVGDLHLATDLWGDPAPTLFVHAARAEAGDEVFARLHPGARVVADPGGHLFHALDIAPRRTPRFSSARILPHLEGGRALAVPTARSSSVPILIQLTGTSVAWRQAYADPGAHPEVDRILRLARIVARARGAGRAA